MISPTLVHLMKLTCGINSSTIVVSIGMLPPTPKPTRAMRVVSGYSVSTSPSDRPEVAENITVRLNAHCRPGEALAVRMPDTDLLTN